MSHRSYHQGYFKPLAPEKYKGLSPIIYRSQLELNLFRLLDRNQNVTQWGSESVIIPYMSPKDGKIHKYFTDAVFHLKTPDGVKKYLVEVKPSTQIRPPNPHGNKKKTTILYEQINWAVNSAKWEAAREWCKDHGYTFQIMTEKDLKI